MVNIPKRDKDPFLTPKQVEDGDLAIIIGTPEIQSADKSKFGKERTIITIKLKRTGEIFCWGLNTTSNDRLVDKLGEDGDSWEGSEVRVEKRIENVRGQDRSVLYAMPSKQTEITATETPITGTS